MLDQNMMSNRNNLLSDWKQRENNFFPWLRIEPYAFALSELPALFIFILFYFIFISLAFYFVFDSDTRPYWFPQAELEPASGSQNAEITYTCHYFQLKLFM